MKNLNEIIEQCDRLIQQYEEGLALVKRLRRQAIEESRKGMVDRMVENAWGVPIRVRRPRGQEED